MRLTHIFAEVTTAKQANTAERDLQYVFWKALRMQTRALFLLETSIFKVTSDLFFCVIDTAARKQWELSKQGG